MTTFTDIHSSATNTRLIHLCIPSD